MLYLAVSLRFFFKYFKSEKSPLRILTGTISNVIDKDSADTRERNVLESIFTEIKRDSFYKSDTIMELNFTGMLL